MKKSILVSLTVAALSVAASPSALAQSVPAESTGGSYLSTRMNMDQPQAINAALGHIQTQREQIGSADSSQAADFLAGRESIDGLDNINAIYQDVADNRALAGSGTEARDYLAERKNMDSLNHINQILSQTVEERVSQR